MPKRTTFVVVLFFLFLNDIQIQIIPTFVPKSKSKRIIGRKYILT